METTGEPVSSIYFAVAFLAGLIPAIFWLWFWLREDREKPEPYSLIAVAFLGGMAAVVVTLPLQKVILDYSSGENLIFLWVIIEEVLKYAAALIVVLWHRAVDEPIDLIIYMIAIALGFAALENALFVFNPLSAGEYATSALTGLFRFLGATLLHVLASGTVGAALALTYYRSKLTRSIAGLIGLFIAIVLHALFNLLIMDASATSGESILGVFLFVWMGVIILFLVFEKVKLLEAKHNAAM